LRIVDLEQMLFGIVGIGFIRVAAVEDLPAVHVIADIAVPELQHIRLFLAKLERDEAYPPVVILTLGDELGARTVDHRPVRNRVGVLHGQAGVLVLVVIGPALHPGAELARREIMLGRKHQPRLVI
jgi:hypothetical protein